MPNFLEPSKKHADAAKVASICNCRVCYSSRLVKILSLGNQYVSDFVTSRGKNPLAPLELVRCSSCGLVQLRHTFPRNSLYRHYWYRSGISGTMRAALSNIVSQTCEVVKPTAGDLVLDIGCNDGTLLRSYPNLGLYRVGFEPAENLVPDARKGTDLIFNEFFGYRVFKQRFGESKAKIITSIAMFYDLEAPNEFVSDVAKCLDSAGVWVIQQNYLVTMLEQNGFDNIGHEHLEYYSLDTLTKLLHGHGLEVFRVQTNDVNGGSFRTYVCHKGDYPIEDNVNEMREREAELFSDNPAIYLRFASSIRRVRSKVKKFVSEQVNLGKTVYVYGASNRGNTILQYCGLDHRLVGKAVDANSEKWGRKTVGTRIPIISKAEGRKDRPDYFLILPHHFLDEIIREEKTYIDSGGKFIVPLPEFRVISSDGTKHRSLQRRRRSQRGSNEEHILQTSC